MKIIFALLALMIPATPIMLIIGGVTAFFCGRNKLTSPREFTSRAYSVAKRITCTWLALIITCIVLSLILGNFETGYLLNFDDGLIVGLICIIAAGIWGCWRARTYCDCTDRTNRNRRIGLNVLAIFLFPFFIVTLQIMTCCVATGFDKHNQREYIFTKVSRNIPHFLARKLIPEGAQELTFIYRPGFLSFGASVKMRCRVTPQELQAFAKYNGYKFQGESLHRNSCDDGPADCDFIHITWNYFNKSDANIPPLNVSFMPHSLKQHDHTTYTPYPKKFLAYSYRRGNCGGETFLYDVRTQTLYADWSSN